MREDLIERLQLKRDVWRGTEFGDDICELLDEAAAALEAAREDAERWRHARKNESDGKVDLCVCRVTWGLGICDGPTEYEVLTTEAADAAIDQARGKGVADEA